MGCNCGQANAPMQYIYTPPNGGPSVTYDKEVLARAAKIRDGGTGTITVVAKR